MLKMMNAPTTTPSAAKPSSRPVRRSRNSLDVLVVVLPPLPRSSTSNVRAQLGAQRAPAARRRSRPGAAFTYTTSSSPVAAAISLRRREVKASERERPGVGALRRAEQTDQVERPRGPADSTSTVSPTRNPSSRAVSTSITTSSARRAHGSAGRRRRRAASDPVPRPPTNVTPAEDTPLSIGFAVPADELRVALDEPAGGATPSTSAHLRARRRGSVGSSSPSVSSTLHDQVDPRQRLLEHALERRVEGVGQHVGRGHERHAEEHREPGEREAELAREQTPRSATFSIPRQ